MSADTNFLLVVPTYWLVGWKVSTLRLFTCESYDTRFPTHPARSKKEDKWAIWWHPATIALVPSMKNYPAENLVKISAPLPQLQAEKRIGTRLMLCWGGGSQFLAQGSSPQSVVLAKNELKNINSWLVLNKWFQYKIKAVNQVLCWWKIKFWHLSDLWR